MSSSNDPSSSRIRSQGDAERPADPDVITHYTASPAHILFSPNSLLFGNQGYAGDKLQYTCPG